MASEPELAVDPELAVEQRLEGSYCTGCGSASSACGGCRRPLDPPRFCPSCGRRLTVAVSPGGYRANCRDCGPVLVD